MSKAVLRNSERIYSFLLKFYPKRYQQEFGEEMKYVFSESLKEAYNKHGEQRIIKLWGRTILDTGKSLFIQHVENQKGGDTMKTKNADLIMQNKIFIWLALGTGLILMIPVIMMQLTTEWNWGLSDFIVIAILLFGMGSLFVWTARKINKKYRLITGILFVLAILYIWAELAVGIFTNLGS